MQKIAIVGLGHVGASLGLALKQWITAAGAAGAGRREIEVVGFDYDPTTQKRAEKLGAVDRTQWGLGRTLRDAALVVLAIPGTAQRRALQEMAPLLDRESILTDMTPHKQHGLAWASELLPGHVQYIGGHPVLPVQEGMEPSADLFQGVTYALFPHPSTATSATEVVVGLVQAVGAKPYFPDAAEHDSQVAATSTLPALAAVAMMHTVAHGGGNRDLGAMTSSDLAGATQLAALPPELLAGMVSLSSTEIVRWLDVLTARLGELRDLAARGDGEAEERLRQFLSDTQDARTRWLQPQTQESAVPRESVATHFSRMFLGGLRRRKES